MGYTNETLAKASSIIHERHSTAQAVHDTRRLKILSEIPEIRQYDSQLSNTGVELIKAIGMDKTEAEKYIRELSEMNLRIQGYIREELRKHGYPEDYLEIPYTCKKCEDTGFVGGYVCECRKELLKQLNISALEKVSPAAKCRFDNFSLDYYPDEIIPTYGISPREKVGDILQYCKCYAEDFDLHSGSLYMSGATGLGKTHLSLAIANVVASKGYNICYESARNLMTSIEVDSFSRDGNKGETENRMINCDLLIIDDLGSEFANSFTNTALYNIINSRINLSKPVIISTNLSPKELEEKYDQRIMSRIIGSYTHLLFIGQDIRQIKSNE